MSAKDTNQKDPNAKSTFGIPTTEGNKTNFKEAYERSGFDRMEDWMKHLVNLERMKNLKEGKVDYTSDLNELEMHTSRIYELVANMITRSIHLKDEAVHNLQDQLGSKDQIIMKLQEEANTYKDKAKELTEQFEEQKAELEKATSTVSGLQRDKENNEILIEEYKKKVDKLSTIVSEYTQYKEENDQIKADFEKKREKLESALNEAVKSFEDEQTKNERLKSKLHTSEDKLTSKATEIEQLRKQAEAEKTLAVNQAVVDTKAECQASTEALKKKYEEKIEKLNKQADELREKYDQRIATLYERLDSSKTKEDQQ